MRFVVGLLAFAVAVAWAAEAAAQVAAPVAGGVVRYRVEVEAPEELAKMLRSGLTLVHWERDPQMSAEQLRRLVDDAVREAREAAATEGWFAARVEARIDESVEPRVVRVRVEPGERTHVSDVEISFRGPATEDAAAKAAFKRVRQAWNLRRGEPFRQRDWEAAKRLAVREMQAWRYAAATIADSRATIDPQSARASLMVEIDSGPPFRFGEVRVSGTRRYPPDLVGNLSPIRPGDDYDRDKVLLYQRRLLETGYFASVQADIDAQPRLAEAAPLRVSVIEASSQHFETGLSYNTDVGLRAEISYSNQDIFDSAWRFRSALKLDQKIQDLRLDFDSPPRPGAVWNNFFTTARQQDIQNERTREFAVGTAYNFGFERTPSAWLVSWHLEEQRVLDQQPDTRYAVYFGHRRTFRHTDDIVSPRNGYYGSFEIGGTPGEPIASRAFLRVVASGSYFFALGRRDDVLLRAQAGAVASNSREGIPSTFLFRTGGDQTVRGYAFESLGVQQGEAIVGGRRLAVASAEYTRWIGDAWGVAAFVDAGDAWDSGVRFTPALGYGVGARVRTPIGPIRADLAYGERVSGYRVHFSVGFNF
ncbi:MAG TPA: BamA/TamA family outer membrane protein [Burkholderiales bacterium]|nr:BamA/TamA family outer membrane protein [Burkholderiales bacterium]